MRENDQVDLGNFVSGIGDIRRLRIVDIVLASVAIPSNGLSAWEMRRNMILRWQKLSM